MSISVMSHIQTEKAFTVNKSWCEANGSFSTSLKVKDRDGSDITLFMDNENVFQLRQLLNMALAAEEEDKEYRFTSEVEDES